MHYRYKVPREVKHQHAIAKRTSQIMIYGQDVIIQIGKMYYIQNSTRCSRWSKHTLPHA